MTRSIESTASLRLENVAIKLGRHKLIEIATTIEPGEILTVMGPSGSGKSTLLAFVAGFLEPAFTASGHVHLGGRDITRLPSEKRRTGLLFQDPMLFPHMSIGQNLLFALRSGTVSSSQRRQKVEQALAEAGIDGFFDRDPATLSGGQKARAALMRILLSEPQALLLDEPFSRLDRNRRAKIRSFVFEEARANDLPVLLVTHDHEDAEQAGGPIFELG